MCRILSYLGKGISVEDLLYKPDNSFIKQSYHPIYMSHLLNLAGFGMIAWDPKSHNPQLPFIYKTTQLPFYDDNLHHLVYKISPHCLLAHLRGVAYNDKQVVSIQNVHPFKFHGTTLALAHNGVLIDFEATKYDFLPYISPQYADQIHGTTDSEWIYALFLSQIEKAIPPYQPTDIIKSIIDTLKIIKLVRDKNNIHIASPVNLFISNGEFIVATRFVFDYGWQPTHAEASTHFTYHSLWYTYGERYGFYDGEYKMKGGKAKSSIIIASEPLTADTTTWIEIPEYTLIYAEMSGDEVKIISQDIHL